MGNSRLMREAQSLLKRARERALSREERREMSIELAECMLNESRRIQTNSEKSKQSMIAKMLNDPQGKLFLVNLTDRCFRSVNPIRIADEVRFLLQKFAIPHFLPIKERLQFALFKRLSSLFPRILVAILQSKLRSETIPVVLPGETKKILNHISKRVKEGVDVNLNRIGESILNEKEAENRINIYLKDLMQSPINCISVKISSLYSQINLIAWDDTVAVLSARLKEVYRAAKQNFSIDKNGKKIPKFVNLDMEEYRDLHLTLEVFKQVLSEAEFQDYSAGIALQSYLPESYFIQEELTKWAIKRVSMGGAPIKIRLVKGANLAMERVEASTKGWPLAPYHNKIEVDANFKKMLNFGCHHECARAVHIGVASHNLFDIAYALILRSEMKVENEVCFEMLEGMADSLQRVVHELSGNMLLYCPTAVKSEFQYALAYLLRRLDENTGPENFLRHAFDLLPGTVEWQEQADIFSTSIHVANDVSHISNRLQDRLQIPEQPSFNSAFENEADTDWTLSQNRKWIERVIEKWSSKNIEPIPLVIGQNTILSDIRFLRGQDPSYPDKDLYHFAIADDDRLELAIQTSVRGYFQWSQTQITERLKCIENVAQELRLSRGDLVGAMIADTGKIVAEADAEVSESIDFAMYYRRNIEELYCIQDIDLRPKGPIVVASPWNFPCSIAAGGILAALCAGNSVIFKPALEAVLVGWILINIFWKAGIGKDVLQFFCCQDDPIGSRLIQDPRIHAVILTGATNTAYHLHHLRPGLELFAETGGKNTMIITSMSDRDLAIKDLIQSAFGYAGQKCSACSLAILEKELYDDPKFKSQLVESTKSLRVGSPWNLLSRVPPLIRYPEKDLLRGLTVLEEGEEWLLKPLQDKNNPLLWSPGIKLGVKPGGFTHQTELFGPVLGLMRAENLDEAIKIANGTPYGLTAGIHTLDEREQKLWIDKIIAGNCYINRTITGAIVRRQPFGGCKASSFGRGAKAGGPNYVLQLMNVEQKVLPTEKEPLSSRVLDFSQRVANEEWNQYNLEVWKSSLGSYAFFWNHYFSRKQDPSLILGEKNIFQYLPQFLQTLRIQETDANLDINRVVAAALTCGAPLEISFSKSRYELKDPSWQNCHPHITFIDETEEQFYLRCHSQEIQRVRFISLPNEALQKSLSQTKCTSIVAKPVANGRIELLHFLREVTVSFDYHRYGYLGTYENEKYNPITENECGFQCRCNC